MNPQGTIFMVTPTPYGNYCVMYTMEGGWGTEIGEASGLCHIAEDGTIMGDGYDYNTGIDAPGIWTGEFGRVGLRPGGGRFRALRLLAERLLRHG